MKLGHGMGQSMGLGRTLQISSMAWPFSISSNYSLQCCIQSFSSFTYTMVGFVPNCFSQIKFYIDTQSFPQGLISSLVMHSCHSLIWFQIDLKFCFFFNINNGQEGKLFFNRATKIMQRKHLGKLSNGFILGAFLDVNSHIYMASSI